MNTDPNPKENPSLPGKEKLMVKNQRMDSLPVARGMGAFIRRNPVQNESGGEVRKYILNSETINSTETEFKVREKGGIKTPRLESLTRVSQVLMAFVKSYSEVCSLPPKLRKAFKRAI